MESRMEKLMEGDDPVETIEYRYLTFSTAVDVPDESSWAALSSFVSGQTQPHTAAKPSRRLLADILETAPISPSRSTRYDDPQTWPNSCKTLVVWLSCLSTFVTTYTPGAYTAGLPQYHTAWGVNTTQVFAGITLFTLCFAISPMFLASLSELTGRRPLFLAVGVIYVISQLGSALSQSFAGLLVNRAIAGITCSVFSTVVGGVISDIYATKDRNTPMAIFSGVAIGGVGVGPMVSGVIVEHLSWRWIYYVQTLSCGLVVCALFLFFPETRGSVLLSRKAKTLNDWYDAVDAANAAKRSLPQPYPSAPFSPSDSELTTCEAAEDAVTFSEFKYRPTGIRWRVKEDEERATLARMIKVSLSRPIMLLFTESVVFWFSLWMSFAWSVLYLSFELIPLIFTRVYGFSSQASGLCFLGVTVASIIGSILSVWQEKLLESPTLKRFAGQPEARLVFACLQSLCLPAGLFWLGASARPEVPWIVPALSIGCFTLGAFSVYLAVFNYLADTYHAYASSAIAAQSFARNFCAACLPLAAEPMLDGLGLLGTGCLLGGLALALSVVPWVLVLWGPQIRRRSRLLAPTER